VLLKQARDPDPRVRLAGVEFLEMLGDGAAPAAPLLAQSLEDTSPFVRWAAARVLSQVAPQEAAVAVPALAKRMSDPDLDVRLAAAYALLRYGRAAEAAVPALAKAARVGDVEARVAAMQALAEAVGKDGKDAALALGAELGHPDARVRRAAAQALVRLGDQAAPARPALRRALNDSDDDVRRSAGEALLSLTATPAPAGGEEGQDARFDF
jgi:HEAT repeat protein